MLNTKNKTMKKRKLAIVLLGSSLAVAVFFLWRISPKGTEESDTEPPTRVQREPTTNDVADGGQPKKNERQFKGELGLIELVGLQKVPEFRSIDIPIPRRKTFRDPDGRTVTLQLNSDAEILRIEPNPSNSHYLVCHGAQREWEIYGKLGEHIADLPTVADLAPDIVGPASTQWRWRLDDVLIAAVETYEPRDPSVPRYPDEDNIPKVFGFYDYYLGSNTTQKLNIPEDMSNGLLRLEGVSEDGAIVISKIAEDGDYWGERDRSELHAFHVSDAQQK